MTVKNAAISIANLLFEEPIFKWVPENETDINVLLIGSSDYATAFADMCLQIGQMYGRQLTIIWTSRDIEETKSTYLAARPALPSFAAIDGDGDAEYASLFFKRLNESFSPEDILLNNAAEASNERIHYCFIATDDLKENVHLAKGIRDAANQIDILCMVTYVADNTAELSECHRINIINEASVYNSELLRLAYNTHISWSEPNSENRRDAEISFKKIENAESSIAFAVSIPYKLSSLNIETNDFAAAASKLAKEDINSKRLSTLAYIEHRRWLMSEVCRGWSGFINGEGEFDGSYVIKTGQRRDKTSKRHIYIARATVKHPLSTWTKAMWDKRGTYDNDLDDYDMISVITHRGLCEYSKKFSSDTITSDMHLSFIRKTVSADINCEREFNHFTLAVKNIIDRSEGYAKTYETYKRKLTAVIENSDFISNENKKELTNHIGAFNEDFYPAVQRNLYYDGKKTNREMYISCLLF